MLVGVDVGGTKTHVRIEHDDGTTIDHVASTRSWHRGGVIGGVDDVEPLLAMLAALEPVSGAALVVGSHGLEDAEQERRYTRRLCALHDGPARAVNDAALLGPAAGRPDAIAVIAGTGSKVIGRGLDGSHIAAGGYGPLLSDEGSAPVLGIRAVRAVLARFDRGDEVDGLGREVMATIGVDGPVALAAAVGYRPDAEQWGSVAPAVFTALAGGSADAVDVVEQAASALAEDVRRVRARGAVGSDVVCAGGVVVNQPVFFRALELAVRRVEPSLSVRLLTGAPVSGAVELARALDAVPVSTA